MSARILIVEEEKSIREVLAFNFEHHGFAVTAVDSPFAAMAVTADAGQLPDVIIVGDLTPRPHTSLGLINDLRVAFDGPAKSIIMVSTADEPIDRISAGFFGADAYLTKPFKLRDLEQHVQRLLAA